jgi:hypothetical protein
MLDKIEIATGRDSEEAAVASAKVAPARFAFG